MRSTLELCQFLPMLLAWPDYPCKFMVHCGLRDTILRPIHFHDQHWIEVASS